MTSKYRGLPDIDTAPDVFETTDEPETLLKPNDNGLDEDDLIPSKPTSEAIDSNGLPSRRKAERVFGRGVRRPDPSNLSFRPRLPPLSRHASTSSSSSESDDPSPSLPRESTAARLRRLKAELAEVEAELASTNPSSTTTAGPSQPTEGKRRSVLPERRAVDVVSELAGLRERLDIVDIDGLEEKEGNGAIPSGGGGEWANRLDRLVSAERGQTHRESSDRVNGGDLASSVQRQGDEASASLSELDKRLALLESVLGPIGDGLDQSSSAPVISTLNKHDHLLALLTQPRHLDAISRRVKLLLVDLDRAASASRRPGLNAAGGPTAGVPGGQEKAPTDLTLTVQEYNSLQSLFSLLPRLDPLLPIIPPLLARLRSLSGLHAEASDIAEGLRKLQGRDKRGTEEVRELQEVVGVVQSGLGDAVQGIKKNWDAVEGRLAGLEKRLKDLEG
ncbi:hypothetical protein CI109_102659 [Kwoniella shandongensis]|uniref:Uncharacterized protein n=1 Tax=Kwoniella shandongensis TaxID=1734106 RepID=A0A5M6BZQ9_9TREE|nr:uncharacterized protein CI109_005239 [Kwoniella shandongensis]KAA5526469.1 hypothetical protein CI109_005239 [Kwoniella shandongensis]